MDANELARWTRFAAKGGIGTCTAAVDCIAQEMGEDLMFLKDDRITVLMQLSDPDVFLGHCEGVVGRFSGRDVRFHGKLKKPVMAKRASVGAPIRTTHTPESPPPSPSPVHAKMAASVSGASLCSVGSASVYSDASTASSDETEKDVLEPPSDPTPDTTPSHSASTSRSNTVLPSSVSDASFASSTTFGPGSVGSLSDLDTKQPFDLNKFGIPLEAQSSFVLAPSPLAIGQAASPAVAPLRLAKSPRLPVTPLPGLPPTSPLPVPPGEHPRPPPEPALPSPLSPGKPTAASRPPNAHAFPGFPGSLAPGQRSPASGSLSPGFRFGRPYGGGSAGPIHNPYPSPPGSHASSPSLPSPYGAPTMTMSPRARRPSVTTSPYRAPLSPPPSSPLPPLPAAALPSPAFPLTVLPAAAVVPMAAMAAAASGGRMSPPRVEVRRSEDGDETTRLSTLDAFRRRFDDSADMGGIESSEEEGSHSDGEVGIGLSMMGALGSEDEEEQGGKGREVDRATKASSSTSSASGSALAWTRYTPTSPVSIKSPIGHRMEEEEEGEGEEEEEEEDGAYWDDIYDDYRYSRYSLASKRFSIMSKASSKARTNAPPVPVPPDRPSFDTPRPDTASSGINDRRPSTESRSSPISVSMPFSRPSLTRTVSDESTHGLTAQFPAVPIHVPLRTESRLRIVHDGYTHVSDDHVEREQHVEHGDLNICVVEAAEDEGEKEGEEEEGQEVDVRQLTSLNANAALSPLLHTTFGSPHSSRFMTDGEDGSDQDQHGRRSSNKSTVSSLSFKSPLEGGMASALKARMKGGDASSSNEPVVRVGVDPGRVAGINIIVNDPDIATEVTSPSLVPPSESNANASPTVVMDPSPPEASREEAEKEDARESYFLRPRPAGQTPHPFMRTSMFLPHPNAPKVQSQSAGPMYGRPQPSSCVPCPSPCITPVVAGTTPFSTHILHQLRGRRPGTLFGRCQRELGTSQGPVPIVFSLDPFPVQVQTQTQTQTQTQKVIPMMRAATVSAPVREEPPLGALRLPARSATTTTMPSPQDANVPSLPIPRQGFVPKVGAARPRSRSFSSFGACVVAAPPERSREEPVTRPSRKTSLPPALMPRQAPTPLVLEPVKEREVNGMGSPTPVASPGLGLGLKLKVPTSPLVQEDVPPVSPAPRSVSSLSPDPRSPPSAFRQDDVPGPGRKSTDSVDSRSVVSPLPEGSALKAKMSLSALRIKAKNNKVDDAMSVVSLVSGENETVQVQDMDFELVKPTLPQVVTGRASQDSTYGGREEIRAENSPVLGDAASMVSSAPRSPLVPSSASGHGLPVESVESIDAHRQRELRWMALFPTVPASQARKNKKVRRLLQEGVPSSVRYLVWCHLTDSKARAFAGVYATLGQRPRVAAFAEMERDAAEAFPDQPRLHTARGPLVSVLQAYLCMVPDIQYGRGLTSIAGQLLLLAPEEDAFWIFASMMDAHLRSYFSTHSMQIEIDASLFSKALEAIDPVLTKKLYMQLSIAPASITRPWFSTLFVGNLPADHLHRVWDIFLYDGIPYLFRIGLVVVNCIRHLLLQATTEEAALAHLVRPPPACLPTAAELLVMAANVKLKDDELRKQRVKMEQQLKRTTTQGRPVQMGAISLPRT